MRNWAGIILFVFVLVSSVFGGVYSGGAGEPNEPFIIASADDLQQIAYEPNDWDKCFKMVADVNLAELGRNFDVIAEGDSYSYFSGVFDGNGHTISNFKCDACDVEGYGRLGGVGVFQSIRGETAEVKNLGIINADVNGLRDDSMRIATLAGGVGRGAKITNCYAENCQIKNGFSVGGLVGVVDEGVLSNCYTTWNVTAIDDAGGLVARVDRDCIIEDCYTTGDVTSFNNDAGGLVGYLMSSGIVENCYSTGNVAGGCCAGGLVGYADRHLKLTNSYSVGDVSIRYEPPHNVICAGGLVGYCGYLYEDTISNCYARGDITVVLFDQLYKGISVGGLIGELSQGSGIVVRDCNTTGNINLISNSENMNVGERVCAGGLVGICFATGFEDCYTTGDVNGFINVGGLVGLYTACNYAKITNCYTTGAISGYSDVGGLIGKNYGVLDNCYATGDVNGYSDVGGLIGENGGILNSCYAAGDVNGYSEIGGLIGGNYGVLDGCYATGDANGSNDVGGLVGENDGILNGCYATGAVSGFDSGESQSDNVGGLVGDYVSGNIKNCFARGDVKGVGNVGGLIGFTKSHYRDCIVLNCYAAGDIYGISYVGGLVGYCESYRNDCILSNCYATGDVNGVDYVGGFAGYVEEVGIVDSHSTGEVYGESSWIGDDGSYPVGGFIGLCYYSSIANCFWDVESSGVSIGIGTGFSGLLDPWGVHGKTTAEMKDRDTFVDAGWDFVDVWGIGDGQTYPYLRQYSVADVSRDGVVNFVDLAMLADRWLK